MIIRRADYGGLKLVKYLKAKAPVGEGAKMLDQKVYL
jgi:hypothetical protein